MGPLKIDAILKKKTYQNLFFKTHFYFKSLTFPLFACLSLHFWRLLHQSGLVLLDFPFFSFRGHCFPINPTNVCRWGLILRGKTPMWFDHSSSTIITEQESICFFNVPRVCWSVTPAFTAPSSSSSAPSHHFFPPCIPSWDGYYCAGGCPFGEELITSHTALGGADSLI